MRQVFIESKRGKLSDSKDSYLGVDLHSKAKLLPYNSTSDVLSLNSLYNKERDESNKYRIILEVNPICSNVLFNNRTEVVRYEGSSACTLIIGDTVGDIGQAVNNSTFDWRQAIRDTEYTHPDIYPNAEPYVYHCGFDIFNNHMLRKNEFVYINKTRSRNNIFNTINDVVRDNDGRPVEEVTSLISTDLSTNNVHIYQYDTIMSLYDGFTENLKEEDGWYGFYNTTNIAIPNAIVRDRNGGTTDISINKIMNNNKSCEIIDLYPDRSLYSFIPKVNKYRHRIEKNWDYCLTYPFAKDTVKLNEIMGLPNNLTENSGSGAIRVASANIAYTATGTQLVRMKSMLKTTFAVDDYITLYYLVDGESTLNKINNKIRITTLGDYEGNDTDRYFSFRFNEISYKFIVENNILKTIDGKNVTFFYKKNMGGYDCQYYFRKFKKLKNYNNEELISVVNKLAYGENIYGDRIAQVVFTDTIDVTGIVDHNGRILSDLYFTVIKRNKGHELWYDQGITSDEKIEFSHCFGDITTGIDLDADVDDYNVRKLHNIDTSHRNMQLGGNKEAFESLKTVKFIQSGITIDSNLWDEGVYGDIVEFDPYDYTETVIKVVEHRFNTAQREHYKDDRFAEILYDKLLYDDYDAGITKDEDGNVVTGFTVATENVATINNKTFYGNINPEGYFYNPYTKIKLKEEGNTVYQVKGENVKYNNASITKVSVSVKNEDDETVQMNGIRFKTSIDYNIIKGDTIGFYDVDTKENFWLFVENVDGLNITALTENQNINIDALIRKLLNRTIMITKTNEGVPNYAVYLPSSHNYVWRSLVLPSELPSNSDIYDRPFANGCFYIEKNINLFLKRQDPTNEYGLFNTTPAKYNNPMSQYKVWGWDKINFSNIKFNNKLFNNVCM